ncbi:hypothetical protein DC366_13190 [Pelagivirga sediminicola]|uniref:Uncharacterized protein n=1 Tax=Pelagivirga sediminicola TaxID=2170575 RepID=A0A2T7G5E5_9RHOB|nr:hypothetical protein [Pelagivirga sediminicola]PVA09634.1 hypothetical protein DC366_13190 [Pelagivirga sediminicola]
MKPIRCLLLAALLPSAATAQPPRITGVDIARDGMGWKFSVTIRHPDTGWDHYADGWEILGTGGTVLARRPLHHPHVDEQPFTRSLRQVMLPDGTRQVRVRAFCSAGDVSDTAAPIDLPF